MRNIYNFYFPDSPDLDNYPASRNAVHKTLGLARLLTRTGRAQRAEAVDPAFAPRAGADRIAVGADQAVRSRCEIEAVIIIERRATPFQPRAHPGGVAEDEVDAVLAEQAGAGDLRPGDAARAAMLLPADPRSIGHGRCRRGGRRGIGGARRGRRRGADDDDLLVEGDRAGKLELRPPPLALLPPRPPRPGAC